MPNLVTDYYQEQIIDSTSKIKRYEKLVNTYSFFRLGCILIGGILFFLLLHLEIVWLSELFFLLVVVSFAYLVKVQTGYEKKRAFFSALKKVNENELASITEHKNSYNNGDSFVDDEHAYSSDLDIFGKASLFNLINRCASPLGIKILASWLIKPSVKSDILQRQEAVKELKLKYHWVQELKALLLFAKESNENEVNRFLNYFNQDVTIYSRLIRIYILFLPYVFLFLAIASWFFPVARFFLAVPLIINAFLIDKHDESVDKTHYMLGKAGKTLSLYADVFKKLEAKVWSSLLCQTLDNQFKNNEETKFSTQLKSLSSLVVRLDNRLHIIFGPLLNYTLVWNVRQLIAFEDWKAINKNLMPKAFDALANFEALISLSSLHYNYPEWCFPEIVEEGKYTYSANELAHPLIPASQRVSNNFFLQDTNKIDIVTGSNMAGKSTFLRTVGVNAVLAFAGAPVCASNMRISVMNLFAYMRIRDSLNENTSTFKAELNRLQLLLDTLKTERKVYFLVDEMLRGTNSVDKYRGSKAVIEKLVQQKAVGIVATHDLQLAQLEQKYPEYIRNFNFDIQVVDGEMLFDYKLKQGECKTFNASLLLKQIGIDVEV